MTRIVKNVELFLKYTSLIVKINIRHVYVQKFPRNYPAPKIYIASNFPPEQTD